MLLPVYAILVILSGNGLDKATAELETLSNGEGCMLIETALK